MGSSSLRPPGCLLVHGFTGVPEEMAELGAYLSARGYEVRLVLLPGHGTTPEALQRVKWTEWDEAVYREASALQARCGPLFVAGLSMGGALSLHLSLNLKVAGVASLAAPVFRLGGWRVRLVPWIRFVKGYAAKRYTSVKNLVMQRVKMGYTVNPLHAVHELLRLMRHVRESLPQVTAPLLVMHSTEDPVVHPSNAQAVYDGVGSPVKRLIWLQNCYHILTIDNEKVRVFEEVHRFFEEQRQDFSASAR